MERKMVLSQRHAILGEDQVIIILEDKETSCQVPMFVDIFTFAEIKSVFSSEEPVRPMTHDLFKNALVGLGAVVKKFTISEIKDGIYIGTLDLERGNESIQIDCRPSDGIAIAIRFDAPIFMEEKVLLEVMQNESVKENMDTLSALFMKHNLDP